MSPLLILVLTSVAADIPTPSSLLGPKHHNHHAYAQYLKEVEPTKQGPVLFPNDAPPPPRTPLVVTSRPLAESIARSELNNTVAQQSVISRVYRPQYQTQYEYENQPPTLPPIYKAISDHAQQNLNTQQRSRLPYNNYKIKEPVYPNRYETNNINDDDNSDYSQAQNYAFSYIVKDQKTGDDFSHSQQSSGSATNGEYRVRLPDGRMQIVSYTADENGYKADVRYDDDKPSNSIDYDTKRNYDKDYTNYENNQNYLSNHNYEINRNFNPASNQNQNYNANQNYNYDYKDQAYNLKSINDLTSNYDNEEAKPVTEQNYKDDYSQYGDSKEYFGNDYSLEYDGKYDKYDPHTSKFTAFHGPKNPKFGPKKDYVTASTVKPSYEELKPLFIQRKPFKTPQPTNDYLYSSIPIQINVPSTTPSPYFDGTTERVVIIGKPKSSLYTSIKSSVSPVTVTPVPQYTFAKGPVTTPRSFLASTIASFVNLKKNIDFSGAKPVLTNTFIDKINRYLSYK